jgi:tetratricopeptide (TPR) repeat protein
MRKLIIGLLSVVIMALPLTCLYPEIIITLRDGQEIESEAVSGDDNSIKAKSKDGIYIFKRIDVKSIKEKMPREELLLPAEELYERMRFRIDQTDPEAHYQLGLFCLGRNLSGYAAVEFNGAKELDNEYAAVINTRLQSISEAKSKGKYEIGLYYYNLGKYKKALDVFEKSVSVFPDSSLAGDFKKMAGLCETALASIPDMTKEEIEEKLKNEEALILNDDETAKIISSYLLNLAKAKDGKSKNILKRYCSEYMEAAKTYLERAESGASAEPWKDFQIAFYCYSIALYDGDFHKDALASMQKIEGKMNENLRGELLMPPTLSDLKRIEAFIEGLELEDLDREVAISWYHKLAKDYETRAKKAQGSSAKRELLNTALNCYLVLANSFPNRPEVQKVGVYGWARCFEIFEKLK